MGKLLPIIFLILGVAIGGGAGIFLKPEEVPCEGEECEELAAAAAAAAEEEAAEIEEPSYIAMKAQFVVPVIENELVKSLVVMSISLEVAPAETEYVFSREPKLRDTFLQVMFDHAHVGGFDGAFTESGRLSVLRVALLEAAHTVVGKRVSDILITDIVRQEI
ncbi:MAG: flagellar basal body-associated protein FliL [Silicimonas sp.]|nr:flagellar basal body-associated protein FliL [Silicimonas sp.]